MMGWKRRFLEISPAVLYEHHYSDLVNLNSGQRVLFNSPWMKKTVVRAREFVKFSSVLEPRVKRCKRSLLFKNSQGQGAKRFFIFFKTQYLNVDLF